MIKNLFKTLTEKQMPKLDIEENKDDKLQIPSEFDEDQSLTLSQN